MCRFLFRWNGWKIQEGLPEGINRCVMIAAPHTSNWDFPFMITGFEKLGIPIRFTIKKEHNRPVIGSMIESVGALWIDRSPRKEGEERPSMTQVMIELFEQNPGDFVMLVTPEGTRSLRTKWRTSYYHVAKQAGVPIGLGYLDFDKKVAGVGKLIYPSDDMAADFREIMAFYKTIPPKNPDLFSVDLEYDE